LWLLDVAVRTDGEAPQVLPAVRDAIWSVDPRQPVTLVRTLDETLAIGQAEREFQTWLFLLFAALALALAIVGAYGAVTYAISQRTTEIGLRLALGAKMADVTAWVVRRAAPPVAAGTAAGLACAWFLSQYLSSQLFGIAPTDPASYTGAAAIVVVVAVGAGFAAARSATNVEPATVLK
jgi:ABC-type antimicrobial peptide transport system permease subunit